MGNKSEICVVCDCPDPSWAGGWNKNDVKFYKMCQKHQEEFKDKEPQK